MKFTSKDLETYQAVSNLISRANKVTSYYSVEWRLKDFINDCTNKGINIDDARTLILLAFDRVLNEIEEEKNDQNERSN